MPRQILMILITFAVTTASASDEIKCNPGGNQLEINACARDDFAKADSELNKTYQALIKKEADDKLFISKLRLAQKAWLAFRDAELDARFCLCGKRCKNLLGEHVPDVVSLSQGRTHTRKKQTTPTDAKRWTWRIINTLTPRSTGMPNWFIKKAIWANPSSIKSNVASPDNPSIEEIW
jgi:uncharacterized protein YecT (DUF1311 family)